MSPLSEFPGNAFFIYTYNLLDFSLRYNGYMEITQTVMILAVFLECLTFKYVDLGVQNMRLLLLDLINE